MDYTQVLLIFVAIALLYGLSLAVARAHQAVLKRPWILLVALGVFGAMLLTRDATTDTRPGYASFVPSTRHAEQSHGRLERHDL